jgi:DAK2 domain fusion protein YloV
MCSTATLWLERNAPAIDALNVFPVPDGDTGTNMLLTLRAAVAEARSAHSRSISEAAAVLAHGALMGARGNSGVILSQFLQGLAADLRGRQSATPEELAQALVAGSAAAYRALSRPVEGTILTVARAAGKAALEAAGSGLDVADSMKAAAAAAAQAVARTPEQMETLREAGVVDAGGEGFRVMLEGAAAFLRDGRVRHAQAIVAMPAHGPIAQSDHEQGFGFCTELMVHGAKLPVERLRQRLAELGTSVMVVGDPTTVRVHVHTATPQAVVKCASQLGLVDRVKIEDMDAQHREASRRGRPTGLGVVAVAWGEGFARTLESLGAARIVRCGQTMNPSVFDLLDAVDGCPTDEVAILPSNPNVIPAARQVGSLTVKKVTVVPADSLPQGIAALLAYNAEAPPQSSVAAMDAARREVRTLEITRATRDTKTGGRAVRAGQAIALLEGKVVAAAPTEEQVASEALAQAGAERANIVTVYYGEGRTEEQARALAERLCKGSRAEWEVVWGGQPHYSYILSVE